MKHAHTHTHTLKNSYSSYMLFNKNKEGHDGKLGKHSNENLDINKVLTDTTP